MSADNELHMIRLDLSTPRLFALMRAQRLPLQQVDLGYAIHCQMAALFGELIPKPFAIEAADRLVKVLGYCSAPIEELESRARAIGDPLAYSLVDWTTAASKPMPSTWSKGQRLHFAVEVCPTVRKSKAGEYHRAGAEVDAFLARCWAVGDPSLPIDRAETYAAWLRQRIDTMEGATILEVQMTMFKRQRMTRLTQGGQRRAVVSDRPQTRLEGVLEVTDAQAFTRLLRRGVGRHRAFGLGMMLLMQGRG